MKHWSANYITMKLGILISMFLSLIWVKVEVNCLRSLESLITMGVSQGSVPGPLLLIYINAQPILIRDNQGIVLFTGRHYSFKIFKLKLQQTVSNNGNDAFSNVVNWFNVNTLLL